MAVLVRRWLGLDERGERAEDERCHVRIVSLDPVTGEFGVGGRYTSSVWGYREASLNARLRHGYGIVGCCIVEVHSPSSPFHGERPHLQSKPSAFPSLSLYP